MAIQQWPRRTSRVMRGTPGSTLRHGVVLVFAVLACCLPLAGAAMAADIQLNAPDHNAINLGNFTTESETNVAISGSSIVVGYNSSKQAGLLGSGGRNNRNGSALSTDRSAKRTDRPMWPGC